MAGEDDGGALRRQRVDQIPCGAAGGRIEAGGGFVEEQQLGLTDDAEPHIEPSLLSTGQRLDPGIGLLLQAHQFDHFVHRPGIG